ncbi:hypothetical protein [Pseudomonas lurida]|uniref:hypothetical protein n=1 Tax=Pseudomonas lurida TaxID=244566 RepID=UPI001F1637C3|nr:hypothetical protein [Pseudomonas lurida]MCF5022811.1 hypothetical protein [Pseudomonas lurida]MCF5310777.1 hypothetical protein [Pseudomonas lurida]
MNNLADIALNYLWTLNFSSDDLGFDEDWVVKEIDSMSHEMEHNFTDAERQAVKESASRALTRWLREPDEHGYTPRKLLKPEQRIFLECIASGKFSGPEL